jgi:ADP-ribosylglycohydrolase
MLIEIAIADAYGAGFEYADLDVYRDRNNLTGYVRHRRHKNVPGTYTDDTQMPLAIAEMIVEGRPWTKEELAEKFVAAFADRMHGERFIRPRLHRGVNARLTSSIVSYSPR